METDAPPEASGVEHSSSVDAAFRDRISRISVDVDEEEEAYIWSDPPRPRDEDAAASPFPLSMGEANLVGADGSWTEL